MKPFTILIQRSVVHEARVELLAKNADEATSEAKARAENDLVHWVEVHRELGAEAEHD